MARIHAQRAPGIRTPGQVPLGSIEVDWSHPLARNLSFFYAPGSQSGLKDIAGNGPNIIPTGPNGIEIDASGGSLRSQNTTFPYGGGSAPLTAAHLALISGSVSFMFYGRYRTGSSFSHSIGIDPQTEQPPHGAFSIENASVLYTTGTGVGGTGFATSGTISGMVSGSEITIIASWDTAAATITYYTNGVYNGTTTGVSTYGPDYTGGGPYALQFGGNRLGLVSNNASNNNLYAAAWWNRALSADDALLLSRDPFAMLRPVQVRRRATSATTSGVATGTGTATGTFTPTATGASLAAAAGTTTGTFTTTAVGRRNAASAGTATGTFTATAVGARQAASAGTATGTFTATGVSGGAGSAVGTATGTFTTTGVGRGNAASGGTATIVGTTTGIGAALANTAGSAAIVFNASAVGAARAPAAGTATATFTATAVPGINAVTATGTATGTFTAAAVGRAHRRSMPMFTIIS